MKADIDRATNAARTAATFDWTWQPADLTRYCTAVDWQITELGDHGATLHTGFTVDRPEAIAYISQHLYTKVRALDQISIWVSDIAAEDDPQCQRVIASRFAVAQEQLVGQLGPWTRMMPGQNSRLRWDLPAVVLILKAGDRAVHLDIVNPACDLVLGLPHETENLFYPEILDN